MWERVFIKYNKHIVFTYKICNNSFFETVLSLRSVKTYFWPSKMQNTNHSTETVTNIDSVLFVLSDKMLRLLH